MSQSSAPAGPPEPEPQPRAAYGNPGMRISDAERAEVSDRLSKHYGDGRLDEAEFGQRLDQAMHAVTQSDLDGLFDDLPDGAAGHGGAADGARPRPRVASRDGACASRRPRTALGRVVLLGLLIVALAVIANGITHLFFPWILVVVVAILFLRRGPGRRHHRSSPEA